MNIKKYLHITITIVGLAVVFLFSSSCKKIDTEPKFTFTIVAKAFSDSTRSQNTYIEVFVPKIISDVAFEGYTDENGEITFEYPQDAVFEVRATRGEAPDYSFIGCTIVRLEPNENVVQNVYLKPYDDESEGCFL